MTALHSGVTQADAPAPEASLPPELTIYTVGATHERMRRWPAETPILHVDAAAVSEVDSAGVQLLVSLHRTALQRGQQLVLDGASPALADVTRRLGAAFLFTPATVAEPAP